MGGERYCPVCQGPDGCFYFTPGVSVSPGQEIVREAFSNVSNETLKEIDKELGISVARDDGDDGVIVTCPHCGACFSPEVKQ